MKGKGAVRAASELMIKTYFLFTLISNAFIYRPSTSILKLRNQVFIIGFSPLIVCPILFLCQCWPL